MDCLVDQLLNAQATQFVTSLALGPKEIPTWVSGTPPNYQMSEPFLVPGCCFEGGAFQEKPT